jgi:hypothetical protein
MESPLPREKELLKALLEPLLEDFQYWFTKSRSFLESERLTFLETEAQNDLLERVKNSQREVSTAQMLFKITNGEAGIETSVLLPWHKLVSECWEVARRSRLTKAQYPEEKSDTLG